MTDRKNALDLWHDRDTDDRIGTSTSDAEAPLRAIGEQAFGIRYPRNVTPRKQLSQRTER